MMEGKQCTHLKDGVGIDRDFLKAKKTENDKFECKGKLRDQSIYNVR